MESDDDGNVHARFASLGVALLVERVCAAGEALRAMEDLVVEGPAVRSFAACWPGQPGGTWVVDAGWPGVRVVECPP